MKKELEVKILNIDVEEIKTKLKNLGAKFLKSENQENIRLTSSKLDCIPNGSFLRIRKLLDRDGKEINSELTYKEHKENEILKEFNEYNVSLENSEEMLKILNFLGYDKLDIERKFRTSYKLRNAHIDIDIWDKEVYPYPYMEIEVSNYDDLCEVLICWE
ncbi:class IV adenylate cyclase [Parvimonas sp. G1425]